MYTIEKGIPIPAPAGGRPAVYPLEGMDVGDSFFIPLPEGKKPQGTQSGVARAARRFADKTFSSRKVEGGIRIWRTA